MLEATTPIIHYDQARFNASDYFRRYTNNKWMYAVSMVLCLALAVLYWWLSTPQYRIQSTIVIKDEKKGEANSINLKELDFLDEQKIVDNEAEIIKSESVISRVVEQLSLHVTYSGKAAFIKQVPLYVEVPVSIRLQQIDKELYKNPIDIELINDQQYRLLSSGNTYRFGQSVSKGKSAFIIDKTAWFNDNAFKQIRIAIALPEEITQNIKKGISIGTPTKNSSVLNISMLHPSPEKGTAILQMIIDEYNNANIREKRAQTDVILRMVEERLSLIAEQLNSYEHKEQNFKVQQGITNLSDDSRMFLDKVKENDQLISQNRILSDMLTAVEKYVSEGNASLAPPNIGINDPVLQDLVNRLNQLEVDKEKLLRTTGESHPLVVAKNNQIKATRLSILQNIQLQKKNIETTLARLQKNKLQIDSRIGSVPGSERNLLEIIREKNIRESVYTFLLQKREEASLNSVAAFSNMRIIDRPYSTARPVKPSKLVILATALLLGIILPTILINLLWMMNNKVNNLPVMEEKLKGHIVGFIPHIKKTKELPFSQQPSIMAEQFRRIRTNINKITAQHTARTMLVTSSIPGEGKTLISMNLAASFALLKKKTVIIDLDLRKPRIHQLFELPVDKDLGQYLSGATQHIEELIGQDSKTPYLHVLAPARSVDQPAEILETGLGRLFDILKQSYEYIIINTPPYGVFTDAQLIEKYTDIALLVIRYGYTPARQLEKLQELLFRKEFNNIRFIVNDVPLEDLHEKKTYKSKYFKPRQAV